MPQELGQKHFRTYDNAYEAFSDDLEKLQLEKAQSLDKKGKPKRTTRSTTRQTSSSSSSSRSTSRNVRSESATKPGRNNEAVALKSTVVTVTATTKIKSYHSVVDKKTSSSSNSKNGSTSSLSPIMAFDEPSTAHNSPLYPDNLHVLPEASGVEPEDVPLPELGAEDEAFLAELELPIFSYKDPVFPLKCSPVEDRGSGVVKMRPAPTLVYVTNRDEADDLVEGMQGPIGFDMEWPVQRRKGGKQLRTALIQIATKDMILLIHLNKMPGFPTKLKELIESETVIKVGINIRNDGLKLNKDFGIVTGGMVELCFVAKQVDQGWTNGRRVMSLQKIVARYLDKRLLKDDVRTSNWNLKLTDEQKDYAGNDTYSGLVLYHHLMDIAKSDGTIVDLEEARVDKKALDRRSCINSAGQGGAAAPALPAEKELHPSATSIEAEEVVVMERLEFAALGRAYVM
ncbi:hypothetical protein FRC03_009500 [Tulasnella sp. 419]|nr:hypothetical protein FRC03_009500 [Tulasnella sp. 419]